MSVVEIGGVTPNSELMALSRLASTKFIVTAYVRFVANVNINIRNIYFILFSFPESY